MTMHAETKRTEVVSEPLNQQLRRIRDAASDELFARQLEDGSWDENVHLSAFTGALYVCLVRATGLILEPAVADAEVRVVRHILQMRNADGGFFKYPGSPSSTTITEFVTLALGLVLGRHSNSRFPAAWLAPNAGLDAGLSAHISETIELTNRLQKSRRIRNPVIFEWDHRSVTDAVAAAFDTGRSAPVLTRTLTRLLYLLSRARWCPRHLRPSMLVIKHLAALMTLYFPTPRSSKRRSDTKLRAELAEAIRGSQNADGGWFFNSVTTMLNLMALHFLGARRGDAAFDRGVDYLQRFLIPLDDGSILLAPWHADTWHTAQALQVCLQLPDIPVQDPRIDRTIGWLLNQQASNGGFPWGSGAELDVENDTTAFVLMALAKARASSPTASRLTEKLGSTIKSATEYLQTMQASDGGFGTFGRHPLSTSGRLMHLTQLVWDSSACDVSARVLAAFAETGLDMESPMVERLIRFLIRRQHSNGGWWARWWSAYLPGTYFVLKAFGRLGIRYDGSVQPNSPLARDAGAATQRAVRFLIDHQNTDGGWGEETAADLDSHLAAKGQSHPIQTAITISALLAVGYPVESTSIRRGIGFLEATVKSPGLWDDCQATYTFYSGIFYYAYGFPALVLPLEAINAYLTALEASDGCPAPAA